MTSIQDVEDSSSSSSAVPGSREGEGNTSTTLSPTNQIAAIEIRRPIVIVSASERAASEGNNLNDRAIQVDEPEWSSTSVTSTTSEYKASSPAEFPSAEHCARLADESVVRIDSEDVVLMKVNMGTERNCLEETDTSNSDIEEVKKLKGDLSNRDLVIRRLEMQLNTYLREGDILKKEVASVKAERDGLQAELAKTKELGNHPWNVFGVKLPRHIPNKLPELQQVLETVRSMVQMLDTHRESLLTKMIDDEHQKRVCGLCFDRIRDETLIPCGHIFCSVCAKRVYGLEDQLCPYCRQRIQRTQKLFM